MNWGIMWQGGPSFDTFKDRVTFEKTKLRERAELDGCRVWKHEQLNRIHLLLHDGVHLNDTWAWLITGGVSVVGAVLVSLQ